MDKIQKTINEIGTKEVARLSGLSPSTISRIRTGQMNPSIETLEKILTSIGYELNLTILPGSAKKSTKINRIKKEIRTIKPILNRLGVEHVTIFGSVARAEDNPESDIDLYLDFGKKSPHASQILKAEGLILDLFPKTQVDFVNDLSTAKGKRLKVQIDRDGQHVF